MKDRIIVLMADDDEDDCLLARDAFEVSESPGRLICVGDGMELLDYLSRYSNDEQKADERLPALILLDLNMPRKDGRQALIEIKSTPAFRHIPVVVLTTSKEEKDIVFSREMGADSFITKPPTFKEWVEMMKALAGEWLRSEE